MWLYKMLLWGVIEQMTVVRNIYTHTVYTSTIQHMKTPEVYKYPKSCKMYLHYLI